MKTVRSAEIYPISSWKIDTEWLEVFAQELSAVDVVSFDIFDTALSRRVDAPVDVFALVEKRLVETLGRDFEKFAELRERAEIDAREVARAGGKEETTFDEIYSALVPRLRVAENHLAAIKQAELDAERAVLFAVPEILAAANMATEAGKRVMFISDMYLPRDQIAALLAACGYRGFTDILVSSECRKTKMSGSLWPAVKKRLRPLDRLLHVGDDGHGDHASPRAHGINALLFTKARSERRRGGPLSRHVVPFSFAARESRLSGAAKGPSAFMTGFGASWGAIVVGSFVKWLEERTRCLDIEHLFFLSRDGSLIQRAWEAAGCGKRTGISSSYLYVSRRVLYLARAACPDAEGQLTEEALSALAGDTPLRLRTMLDRAGLLHCAGLVADAKRTFRSLDAMVEWSDGARTMRELFQRHHEAVLAALKPILDATLGYLAQESVDSRRLALVDLGWNGTMQSALAELIKVMGHRPNLTGFYYSLWPYAQKRRPATGWMEGAFGNDYVPLEEQAGLMNAVGFLENLHSPAVGTTTGYALREGRWLAQMQKSPIEEEQHETLLSPFQDGAVQAIREIFEKGRAGELRLDDLTPAAGRAAIERVALSPTDDELRYLGSIRHSRSFDHAAFAPIVPVASAEDIRNLLADPSSARDWPVGNQLACLRQTLGSSKRQSIVTCFQPTSTQLDARTMRSLS